MGRYFFHLELNGQKLIDREGASLASDEQAKDGAIRALRGVAQDMGVNGHLIIRDGAGRIIHAETVQVEQRHGGSTALGELGA